MPLVVSELMPVFGTFWNSGVHGANWTRDVYSIVIFTVYDNDVQGRRVAEQRVLRGFKNDAQGRHSEVNAITYLREVLARNRLPSQTLQWYVNLSPCGMCSDIISQFINDAKNMYNITIQINMKVPSLYRIRRLSCVHRGCPHVWGVTSDDHTRNVTGLVKLHKHGVIVDTFQKTDWRDLADWLTYVLPTATGAVLLIPRFTYQGTARQSEDKRLKQDLHVVMWLSTFQELMVLFRRL